MLSWSPALPCLPLLSLHTLALTTILINHHQSQQEEKEEEEEENTNY